VLRATVLRLQIYLALILIDQPYMGLELWPPTPAPGCSGRWQSIWAAGMSIAPYGLPIPLMVMVALIVLLLSTPLST